MDKYRSEHTNIPSVVSSGIIMLHIVLLLLFLFPGWSGYNRFDFTSWTCM